MLQLGRGRAHSVTLVTSEMVLPHTTGLENIEGFLLPTLSYGRGGVEQSHSSWLRARSPAPQSTGGQLTVFVVQ